MSSKTLNRRKNVHRRIRKKLSGTAARPRLSVFRSNKSIYAQLIDDETATTLVAVTSKGVEAENKVEQARVVGRMLGTKAKEAGHSSVIFDRSG